MSGFTTELRFLLASGYDIGLRDYPIFDEAYREGLNQKIIDHYEFREIGLEVPALFVKFLNRTMNEIMPYYNQLYNSELLKIDPLITQTWTEQYLKNNQTDGTETGTLDGTTSEKQTGNATGTTTDKTSDDSESNTATKNDRNETFHEEGQANSSADNGENLKSVKDRVYNDDMHKVTSDTPQQLVHDAYVKADYFGSFADFTTDKQNETDITNNATNGASTQADAHTKDNTGTIGETGSSDTTNTRTVNSNGTSETDTSLNTDGTLSNKTNLMTNETMHEDFIRTIQGMQGYPQSDLLSKYRDTFLNIDMMIIEELNPLFMGLYDL